MASIAATPEKAPYPAPAYLKLGAKEMSDAMINSIRKECTQGLCDIPVHVGLFFDGTNNHMERDRDGKRVPVPWTDIELAQAKAQARREGRDPKDVTGPPPMPDGPMKDKPELCSHSNVARLSLAYPAKGAEEGFFRIYIQGVGTPFPEIGEPTESQEGKAFGKGGLPRIVWGIFQVLNAIYYTAHRELMYDDIEVGQLAQQYARDVGQVDPTSEDRTPLTHEAWFRPHLDKLREALHRKPKPRIPSVSISVFGFSRGAAEATAFCHRLDRLLEGGKLAGIATHVQFLGLFDVVASVGGSASVSRTLPLPDAWFDGHWDWANDILKPLPGSVHQCVHLIAAHEQRMNFPVTQIVGAEEILFPGVHSDVGGGYGPGEQGRSRDGQGSLLSQIPLLYMYRRALMAGVPLVPFAKLRERDQADFDLNKELASAWEAYTKALGSQGGKLMQHMRLFFQWRALRLQTLEASASFQAASAQSKQDLLDANRLLAGDVEALRFRRDNKRPLPMGDEQQQRPDFLVRARGRMNQWHRTQAEQYEALDELENIALECFEHPKPLAPDVATFFDDYIHDSFAGFYLAGAVTEFEKRKITQAVQAKKPANRNAFERKVAELADKVKAAQGKKEAGEPLTAEEEALLKEAEGGTPYPTMSDSDVDDMVSGSEKVIFTQTDTRREGGGYIIRRGYYPKHGFFKRRSINEEELNQQPDITAATTTAKPSMKGDAEEVPTVLVWSEHLGRDIAQARAEDARIAHTAIA